MTLLLIFVIGMGVSAGLYLLLAKDLFRLLVGLGILGSMANLILFMGGHPGSLIAPVIEKGAERLSEGFANPLSQALVLTAIVISFSLLAFSLLLGARVAQSSQDPDRLRATEPMSDRALKPPIDEE